MTLQSIITLVELFEQVEDLLLILLELRDFLGIAFLEFLHLLRNSLLNGLFEFRVVFQGSCRSNTTGTLASDNLILVLKLLLHSQEASVDLFGQVFDGLVRVDA